MCSRSKPFVHQTILIFIFREIETTSSYDKTTQEFIIHSPTEKSFKFWIGLAGETATHSIVYAHLLIDEYV